MINRYHFENSTMLASCDYDTKENELRVEFKNGRIYTYVDVAVDTYNNLIGAKSAGSYFNSIKKDLKLK